MPIADSRQIRKNLILETFDRQTSSEWKGITLFAKGFGVSRQWVSMLLRAERAEEYAKRRHPSRGQRRVSP